MRVDFDAAFFKRNREQLRSLFTGTAPIVLTANALVQRATSEPFGFVQDASFWYLTGIQSPEVVLVLDKGKEYLILPSRSAVQAIFDGEDSVQELRELSGIEEIYDHKEGIKKLNSRIKRSKHIATIAPSPAYIEVYGMYTNPARAQLMKRLKSVNPDITVLDLRQHIAQLRMVKSTEEIVAIRSAIDVTVTSLKRLERRGFDRFAATFDIETDLVRFFREGGADGVAFDSVIAAGKDTCVVHTRSNKQQLPNKGLLLLDVGAAVNGYCADISRTYFLGTPTKRQKQVFQAVIDVQDHALSILKPGVVIREYEIEIERYMGEKLRELGLIKTIDRDSVRHYFPHATSHHLGIDVHDAADYDKPLAENMVITVEPGIYIPEEEIGIRVEDDILITGDGNKVLTDGLSRVPHSLTIS